MTYCKCGHAETSHNAQYDCFYNYNCDCSVYDPVDPIEYLSERVKHLEEQVEFLENKFWENNG